MSDAAYKKNPFVISFGRPPVEYLARTDIVDKILTTFTELPVTDQIFVISGVRGTGKTVLLSDITHRFDQLENWTVIYLSTDGDMVHELYTGLYYGQKIHRFIVNAQVSVPGIGVQLNISSGAPQKTDKMKIEDILKLASANRQNILVAVDEVSKTDGMKKFARVFQEMISKKLPLYFLGTGIFENIEELQNVKDLTFLYRAPRIILAPLDPTEISNTYKRIFDLSTIKANQMAMLTKGYSFAFQALGYTYWENMPVKNINDILPEYDSLLSRSSYSRLWKEMSDTDRNVCKAIAAKEGDKVKNIRSEIDMGSNMFNTYRRRLKEKGLLNTDTFGKVSFSLPRFAQFVNTNADLYV